MTIDEEFRQAFVTTERYERYKLVRMIGILVFVIGIGRFLLSWIIDQTFLYSLNLDTKFVIFFRLGIQVILILILLLIVFYSYILTKKTSISQGGDIVSKIDFHFGIALCILIYTTFFLRIIASIYFEEVLGIFLSYFILKRGIKNDFREFLTLSIVLFVISIIEFIGRILIVINLWNHYLFVPVWTVFYIGIAVMFMIPYLVFGLKIFKNASLILEEV